MKTHALKLVTCFRCGRRSATILMHRSQVSSGVWFCRSTEACKRRRKS